MPLLVTEGLRVLESQARREPEPPLSGMRATILGGFCLVAGAILIVAGGPWVVSLLLLVLGLVLPLRRGR
jgi:hypothetical protein